MDTNSVNQTAKTSPETSTLIELDSLPDERTRRFVLDLLERHKFHTDLAIKLNRRYKKWSPLLLIFIPVYSAILSFLTTGVIESKLYLSLLSLLLTVAAILNSIIKPDEKFVTSASVLVQLKDWEADLALGLIGIDSADNKQLTEFLSKKSAQLSEIGSSMARTYLPQKNT